MGKEITDKIEAKTVTMTQEQFDQLMGRVSSLEAQNAAQAEAAKKREVEAKSYTAGKQPLEEMLNPHMVQRDPVHQTLVNGTKRVDF